MCQDVSCSGSLDDDVIDLWVMEEYGAVESWSKKLSIKIQTILFKPFTIGYDGKILLKADEYGINYFFWFDR